MRRYAGALLLLLLLPVILVAGCGRAENNLLLLEKLPDVASVDIEGNHVFSDGTLKGLMTTRPAPWWNPFQDHKYRKAQLQSDIQAILTYYMRHGYLRASLVDQEVRHDGDEVHIVLTFHEGEPMTVAEVVIRGAQALNPNDLRKKLAIKAGEPVDPFKLEDDRRLILRTLADQGYWEAKTDADVQFFGNRGIVFYRLTEGRPDTLRKIEITGTHEVDNHLARRELAVKTGRRLRLSRLQKSQLQLMQSGYFADAQWDTTGLDTLDHSIAVRFRVRERRLHWVEGGVGVTSAERVQLTADWGSQNFLGTGMRFALNNRTELDFTGRIPTVFNKHRSDILLNQPHLLGTRWEGQPNLYYLYNREYLSDINAGYSQNVLGAGYSVRRNFGEDIRNQIVLTLENRWVYNNADSAARYSDPQLFRDFYQTRLLTGRVEHDTRNDFFSPTEGSYQTVVLESAGGALGGNNAFRKATVGVSGFHPPFLWKSAVVAARIQVGYIKPSSGADSVGGRPITSRVELIPSEDRYRLGGASTVRGYVQDELDGAYAPNQPAGGLAEFLGNVELRVPLFWRLSTVGFLDAGNVWQDKERILWNRFVPHADRNEVSPFDVRYSYGVGIRVATPVGPIRIDYARKWNRPPTDLGGKDKWHVAIGQAF